MDLSPPGSHRRVHSAVGQQTAPSGHPCRQNRLRSLDAMPADSHARSEQGGPDPSVHRKQSPRSSRAYGSEQGSLDPPQLVLELNVSLCIIQSASITPQRISAERRDVSGDPSSNNKK